MEKERKPHKWVEEIKAFADGYNVESKMQHTNWKVDLEPKFYNNDYIFRTHDPLREVKETFERGETIQALTVGNYWISYNKEDNCSKPNWNYYEKWRVKPKENLEVGDWAVIYRTDYGDIFKKGDAFKIKKSIHPMFL